MKRKTLLILTLLAVSAAAFLLRAPAAAVPALSRIGSYGREVELIQEKLVSEGYLGEGGVDGIFGPKTLAALKEYQKANGLDPDGVAGPLTLGSMDIEDSGKNSAVKDARLELLAHVISAEARGEPYEGQVAVGAVVLNRVRHPSFPDTVAGVIYQRGAFDTVSDGQIDLEPTESAYRAAREALSGADPTGGCVYFYDPRHTSNRYMLSLEVALVIGHHVFCEPQ